MCLEQAIRHHDDVYEVVRNYGPEKLPRRLRGATGPYESMLRNVQHLIANPVQLTEEEFQQIVDFVRYGLTDPDAAPEALTHLVPLSVPSGLPVHDFELDLHLGGDC